MMGRMLRQLDDIPIKFSSQTVIVGSGHIIPVHRSGNPWTSLPEIRHAHSFGVETRMKSWNRSLYRSRI